VPLVIVWLVLMAAAFYLLLWRPQQRRMSMVRTLQSELKEGDDVLTTSGVYGRLLRLREGDADLEIAPNVVIRVARGAIGQVVTEPDGTLDAHGEATEAG
jgi:preprotein translocase subunit YajC